MSGWTIGASEDSSVFKLLPLDIGLFISQTFEHPNAIRPVENLFEKWTQGNTFERAWLGQIAEVLVGQALTSQLQSGQTLHNYPLYFADWWDELAAKL